MLVDVLGRMERLFDPPMPYMFWWVQRPTDNGAWPGAWLHLELVSPWRGQGLARFVAAGELGGGVLINPVDPDDVAARLRSIATS
jgi:UDPglucose--hexose-1-phosphate uridylyltransferase